MNINTVVSKVLLACIISVLPIKSALSTNASDNITKHTDPRLTTKIPVKKASGTVSTKHTVSMKVKDKENKPKSSQFVIPIIFEKNVGQTDKKVDYLLRQQNYVMYFTGKEFISAIGHPEADLASSKTIKSKSSLLKMSLVNAHARKPEGTLSVKTRINQYIGADEKKWLTGIPGYSQLHYKSIYKGIDMLWKSNGGFPQYQFNVDSNTSEESIRIKFSSSARLSIDKNNLKITLPNGVIFHSEPQFFEEMPKGGMKPLKGHYVLMNKNEIGFKVINRTLGKKLIIDPTVSVITRSINLTDSARDVSLSPYKAGLDIEAFGSSVFVAGTAVRPFGVKGFSESDVDSFIIKMSSSSSVVSPPRHPEEPIRPPVFAIDPPSYITYIGGSGSELNMNISIDNQGQVYFGGSTNSNDFPTPGATFRDSPSRTGEPHSDKQAFVGKLTSFGEMQLGTMIGKGSDHYINDIKFSEGSIYVAGVASTGQDASVTDATPNTLQSEIRGRKDGFVAKLDANLARLEYFTYLGSSFTGSTARGDDFIYGLDVFNNKAYLAGTTGSEEFYITRPNAAQPEFSFPDSSGSCSDEFFLWCYDGFITVLNETGSAIEYSTFYGGSRVDIVNDISVREGLVAITGTKKGSSNVTTVIDSSGNETPESRAANAKHLFVAKLNLTTSINASRGFIFDKQFNIPAEENGNGVGKAIHIDALGNIHVTGEVSRGGLAVGNPSVNNLTRSTVLGESDMFYMMIPLEKENGEPGFFTYFGGEGRDIGQGITARVDSTTGLPCAYIAGHLDVRSSLPPAIERLPQQSFGVYSICRNADDDIFTNDSTFTKHVENNDNEQINIVTAIGDNFTYVIEVFNDGEQTGVATISDRLPQFVSVVDIDSVTGSCSFEASNNTVSCENVSLPAGRTTQIKIEVRLALPEGEFCPASLSNIAFLTIGGFPFTTQLNTRVDCPASLLPPEQTPAGERCTSQTCEEGFVCGIISSGSLPERNCLFEFFDLCFFGDDGIDDGVLTPIPSCLDEDRQGIISISE